MCGRTARARLAYAGWLGFEELNEVRLPIRFNIAPTQLDVFVRHQDGRRRLVASRWGLIPRWAKDGSIASKTFNARAETLAERATFRPLIGTHRCVIPVSGFYEWRRDGKTRTPLYIHRADGGPLALAGLWSEWVEPASGELVTSHTVITCAANAFMAAIHDRMPVILTGAALDEWLDPAIDRPADVLPLAGPCPDGLLTAYPVAPLVNGVHNDGPELIQPVEAA